MSRKLFPVLILFVVMAMLLVACGGATPTDEASIQPVTDEPMEDPTDEPMEDPTEEPMEDPTEEPGETEGPAPAQGERGEILNRVLERGKLVCGSRTDLAGFGYLDENGRNVGFDADICRAVAAAVLGDPEAVEFVPLTAADRGPALQTAEVDLLSRNVTWTSSRDAQWGNFTSVMFYDGQGFMIRKDSGITSPDQFDGATACVTSGTTTEQNLADFFRQNGMEYEAVIFEETSAVYSAYEEGRCDITTSDKSQLAAVRSGFADPDAHIILDITISKEPLTPAVPHGDDAWFDAVKLVLYALVNAEELGVTQANVEEMKSSDNINVQRLLGQEGDWGYTDIGIDADALAKAIGAVGNYGEIYNRYMGPEGDAFTLPRGPNELWSNGGLIYAPPVK